mmetsp:Transcript_4641/g.10917  ORF Transcript_4641/g.10917 Transcript_4641/m.10917 type:complete len:225 (-) Transcript_4641:6-680(-)
MSGAIRLARDAIRCSNASAEREGATLRTTSTASTYRPRTVVLDSLGTVLNALSSSSTPTARPTDPRTGRPPSTPRIEGGTCRRRALSASARATSALFVSSLSSFLSSSSLSTLAPSAAMGRVLDRMPARTSAAKRWPASASVSAMQRRRTTSFGFQRTTSASSTAARSGEGYLEKNASKPSFAWTRRAGYFAWQTISPCTYGHIRLIRLRVHFPVDCVCSRHKK